MNHLKQLELQAKPDETTFAEQVTRSKELSFADLAAEAKLLEDQHKHHANAHRKSAMISRAHRALEIIDIGRSKLHLQIQQVEKHHKKADVLSKLWGEYGALTVRANNIASAMGSNAEQHMDHHGEDESVQVSGHELHAELEHELHGLSKDLGQIVHEHDKAGVQEYDFGRARFSALGN